MSFCYTGFKLLTLFYQSATGHLGNKYKSYRASQAANVNIHSGEATSFKASIKDRVKTTWTEVKTKVGDVKVQAGEAFITSRTVFQMWRTKLLQQEQKRFQ